MNYSVVQVVPRNDFTVLVYFDDGKIVNYDAKNILSKGRLSIIKNIDSFKKACKVLNNTLAFDIDGNNDENTCFDIAPDTLHDLEHIDINDEASFLVA